MSHPIRERSGEITGETAARGDSCEKRGRSDSEWHRNTALAATIQQYAGLAGSGPSGEVAMFSAAVR